MSSAKRSPVRERRILNEIVVDAYTESERAMGWYYYLENQLHFPFGARCISERSISPLQRGARVSVLGMASVDDCMREVFVRIRWGRRSLAVPLMQLEPWQRDPETTQGVADWHYWVRRGYVF
jgi:hypothetical protein